MAKQINVIIKRLVVLNYSTFTVGSSYTTPAGKVVEINRDDFAYNVEFDNGAYIVVPLASGIPYYYPIKPTDQPDPNQTELLPDSDNTTPDGAQPSQVEATAPVTPDILSIPNTGLMNTSQAKTVRDMPAGSKASNEVEQLTDEVRAKFTQLAENIRQTARNNFLN